MADKYEIPPLMNLALKKFKDRVQPWPQNDFAGIVSTVLESTHCKDVGLRPVISEICAKHMEDILGFNFSKKRGIEVKVMNSFLGTLLLSVLSELTRYL